MSNHHFKEKGMSLKAKGLLSLMLSLPDDWDYSVMGLVKLSKDGKDSVVSELKELEEFRYLTRTRIQDEKGKFAGFDYDIYEETQAENPCAENPHTDKPHTENPPQLNTKGINDGGINVSKDKDEKDEKDTMDKRACAQGEGESEKLSTKLSTYEGELTKEQIIQLREANWMKANKLVYELIKAKYIQADDLFIDMYDMLLKDAVNENGFDLTRSCVAYFINRLKKGKAYDEQGNEVQNKFAYLRKCIEEGIRYIKAINDPDSSPFSEKSIKKTLEAFGIEVS
jgi:hypothetical protein